MIIHSLTWRGLSASKVATIPALRHDAEDIVQEASSFFKSGAKRTDVLKCAVEELADSQSHFQDEPRLTVHNEVH